MSSNVQKRIKNEKELIRRNVSVSRVSKVVKGGKRFNFSVLVVVGDGKGSFGFASAKAKEVPDALKKAGDKAAKRMVKIPLKETRTIHQDVYGEFGAGKVYLRSAPKGTGVIAGGAVRSIFDVLGVKDVVAKVLNSSNPHNVVKATFDALKKIQTPRMIAAKRGKKVSELFSHKQQEGSSL